MESLDTKCGAKRLPVGEITVASPPFAGTQTNCAPSPARFQRPKLMLYRKATSAVTRSPSPSSEVVWSTLTSRLYATATRGASRKSDPACAANVTRHFIRPR